MLGIVRGESLVISVYYLRDKQRRKRAAAAAQLRRCEGQRVREREREREQWLIAEQHSHALSALICLVHLAQHLCGRRRSDRCSSGGHCAAIARCFPRVVQGVRRSSFHLFSSHFILPPGHCCCCSLYDSPHLTSPPLSLPLASADEGDCLDAPSSRC